MIVELKKGCGNETTKPLQVVYEELPDKVDWAYNDEDGILVINRNGKARG